VPGYPWVCLLFCIAAAGLVLATVIGRPMGALIAIGMIAIGATVYFLWIKGWTRSGRETSMTSEGVV
jgi:hypothetical protein